MNQPRGISSPEVATAGKNGSKVGTTLRAKPELSGQSRQSVVQDPVGLSSNEAGSQASHELPVWVTMCR